MSKSNIDIADTPPFVGLSTFLRLPYVHEPSELDIAILGVPFDGGQTNTVSGARFAPRAIRETSARIKPYNSALAVNPYEICRVGDVGDVPINPLELAMSRALITKSIERIVRAGAKPISVGGDHSISYPILRAVAERSNPVALVQFDAHSDTAYADFGNPFGHGTPFRRALEEQLIDPHMTLQIGIRGSTLSTEEYYWAAAQGIELITMDDVVERGLNWVASRFERLAGHRVYVSIDMDALDPAFAPGTGPNPGGFTSRELLYLIRKLAGLNIIGGDLVELNAPYDLPSRPTCCLAAQFVFELVCLMALFERQSS